MAEASRRLSAERDRGPAGFSAGAPELGQGGDTLAYVRACAWCVKVRSENAIHDDLVAALQKLSAAFKLD